MTHIQLRQPLIPILIALLLGLHLMEPSRAWTIPLVALAGVFGASYFWTWSLGKNLQLRRETRLGWIQVGGQIEERLTLSNTSFFPASSVEFIDQSTLPDFNASRTAGISVGFFEQWTVNAVCNQRGLFSLGGALIRAGDPFGIFEVSINAPQRTSLLVLPQTAALPELAITSSGTYGDGQPRRNAPQQTIHATTVREYMHGDSMRQIHWPTTARMNKLFVRLMESAPEGNWWILLNLDARDMRGSGWDSVEEQCVTLAASLADFGLRNRKSVGLISNGRELAWLQPDKGEAQRWEIMQSLAIAEPGPTPLTALLDRMGSQLGKHHSLIVITASPGVEYLKTLIPLIKRGVMPTVMLLDPATFGGSSSAQSASDALEDHGIRCHVIPRGLIERPQIKTAQPSQWTWSTTPSGEVLPVRK